MLLRVAVGVTVIKRSLTMLLRATDGVALMIGRPLRSVGVAKALESADCAPDKMDEAAVALGRSLRSVGVAKALESAVCTPARSEEAVEAMLFRTEALVSGRTVGRLRLSESSVLEADWVLCVLLGVWLAGISALMVTGLWVWLAEALAETSTLTETAGVLL